MPDNFYRAELDAPRKAELDPKTWAGSTRQCGKCNTRVPICGSSGSKVHRFWGWICVHCANPTN